MKSLDFEVRVGSFRFLQLDLLIVMLLVPLGSCIAGSMAANHELVSVGSSFILARCDGETSLGKMQLVESNLLLFCLICSLGSKYLVIMHLCVSLLLWPKASINLSCTLFCNYVPIAYLN